MVAKSLLFGTLAVGLVAAYANRDFLLDAYEVDENNEVVVIDSGEVADITDYIDTSKFRTIEFEAADYVVSDTRRVVLPTPTAGAQPVEEIEVEGGEATITGTVVLDGKGVPNANIGLERIVDSQSATKVITADVDGEFEAEDLLGGRYRIRAWLPPELSMRSAEVLFVPDGGSAEIALSLNNEANSSFTSRFDGSIARVGTSYTVVAEFRTVRVNDEGIIEDAPAENELAAITVTSPLEIDGAFLASSDDRGVTRFTVKCRNAGQGRIVIKARGTEQVVSVPECTFPPQPKPDPVAVGGAFGSEGGLVPGGTYQGRPEPVPTPTTRQTAPRDGNGNNGGANNGGQNNGNNNNSGNSNSGNNNRGGDDQRTASTRVPRRAPASGFRFQNDFTTDFAPVFAGSSVCVLEYQLWNQLDWGPVRTHAGGERITLPQTARVLQSSGTPCEYVRVA